MDDSEFRMVVLASMPKEWMIFVSTLSAYTTSTEVIAQIMAHDSMLSRASEEIQSLSLWTLSLSGPFLHFHFGHFHFLALSCPFTLDTFTFDHFGHFHFDHFEHFHIQSLFPSL